MDLTRRLWTAVTPLWTIGSVLPGEPSRRGKIRREEPSIPRPVPHPAVTWLDPLTDWPDETLAQRTVKAITRSGAVIDGRLVADGPDWIVQPNSVPGVSLAACKLWRLV